MKLTLNGLKEKKQWEKAESLFLHMTLQQLQKKQRSLRSGFILEPEISSVSLSAALQIL